LLFQLAYILCFSSVEIRIILTLNALMRYWSICYYKWLFFRGKTVARRNVTEILSWLW